MEIALRIARGACLRVRVLVAQRLWKRMRALLVVLAVVLLVLFLLELRLFFSALSAPSHI